MTDGHGVSREGDLGGPELGWRAERQSATKLGHRTALTRGAEGLPGGGEGPCEPGVWKTHP